MFGQTVCFVCILLPHKYDFYRVSLCSLASMIETCSNSPFFLLSWSRFEIGQNRIMAVPSSRNNIVLPMLSSLGNVLNCTEFGPLANSSMCNCVNDTGRGIAYHRSPIVTACGYTYCVPVEYNETTGCPPNMFLNKAAECSDDGPGPSCISLNQLNQTYYDVQAQSLLPVRFPSYLICSAQRQ